MPLSSAKCCHTARAVSHQTRTSAVKLERGAVLGAVFWIGPVESRQRIVGVSNYFVLLGERLDESERERRSPRLSFRILGVIRRRRNTSRPVAGGRGKASWDLPAPHLSSLTSQPSGGTEDS
jgi:hypothetical protein